MQQYSEAVLCIIPVHVLLVRAARIQTCNTHHKVYRWVVQGWAPARGLCQYQAHEQQLLCQG